MSLKSLFGLPLLVLWLTSMDCKFGLAGETKVTAASAEKPVALSGILEETDPKDKRTMGPSKTYLFKMLKSKVYVIEVMSEEFDSFLRVEDADGKELAWDDDSGGGLNSKLKFVPPQDADYRIIASSFDRKPGKFQLKIQPNDPFKEVIPAAKEFVKGLLTMEGRLVRDGALDDGQHTKGRPRLVQPVKLKAGKKYTIDLISDDFDAFLRLVNPAGKEVAFDDDSGGDLHARIVYACKEDGAFQIIMIALDRNPGAFTLKVREE